MFFYIKLLLAAATLFAGNVMAKEQIEIVWAFNAGSNQANTIRQIINLANTSQSKYQFVFHHKPGASGTIAANYVNSNPQRTVLAMSSSFIIRPYFEKDINTHDLDDFVPVLVQGHQAPLFVVSNRIKDMHHLISQKRLTIGVSGMGSASHLAAVDLAKKIPGSVIINFGNMVEAMTNAAGAHVDVAVGLYSDALPLITAEKLQVLAYSGDRELQGIPGTLLKNHGIDSITLDYAMYASRGMTADKYQEIQQILLSVNKTDLISQAYIKDQLLVSQYQPSDLARWYADRRIYWKHKATQAYQYQKTK